MSVGRLDLIVRIGERLDDFEADGMKPVTLAKGECAVVPASIKDFRVRPLWAVELFCARLPEEKMPHPFTALD